MNKEWEELIQTYRNTNLPYPNSIKVATLAQWMLASQYGTTALAVENKNFANLKYRARMKNHAEAVDYTNEYGEEGDYCHFSSIQQFIDGYWYFISSGYYEGWEDAAKEGEALSFIELLQQKGFSGSSASYVRDVSNLFEEAEKLLALHDSVWIDRPPASFYGDMPSLPEFEYVRGAKQKYYGNRPKGLEGAIVHFTAGRMVPKKMGRPNLSKPKSEAFNMGARECIRRSANIYAFAAISRGGGLFLPENHDWMKWGSHAGTSKCPKTGREGVSRYYVGFELLNPGKLYPIREDENLFCPWYNCVHETIIHRGRKISRVKKDSKGRAWRKSTDDDSWTKDEVRYCKSNHNIEEGWYLPYSREQFDALLGILHHLRDEFPSTFTFDKVFGHDEVSPGRKNDPGGALAYQGSLMTMKEFRALLHETIPLSII